MVENLAYLKDRTADILKMADELGKTIDVLQRMYNVQRQLVAATHRTVVDTHEMNEVTDQLRNHLADFDDFWRPVRSYFYWEKHCFDIPICWSFRALFDSLDSIDQLDEKFNQLGKDLDSVDALQPQLLELLPPQIESLKTTRALTLTMYSTFSSLTAQIKAMTDNVAAMGQAFDAAKNDDMFYLPPEAFDNPDFKRGLKLFVSPDGRSARYIITHRGDPATQEGLSREEPLKNVAMESVKETPLGDANFYLAGTAALYKDIHDGTKYDLLIAGIAALSLIFAIMLIFTRSLVAALVIVGTVTLSLGGAFGLSVLVWQHLLGIELHWLVLPMSIIVLLAVGSDYNLLLVSRFKEEMGAGLRTGLIRAMGGTGAVVTVAGLVFAFTMGSMVVSDLRMIGQVGTTICIGLLFDTLVVRAFIMPAVTALLGRWFWWPQRVRPRPASYLLRPLGSRTLVRSLLLRSAEDELVTPEFPAPSG